MTRLEDEVAITTVFDESTIDLASRGVEALGFALEVGRAVNDV